MAKGVELHFDLETGSGSKTAKLVRALREAIHTGALKPGDLLPATRKLAARFAVSRGTIVAAYEQLIAEGYLDSRQGSGTVVHENLATFHDLKQPRHEAKKQQLQDPRSAPKAKDVQLKSFQNKLATAYQSPKPLRDQRDPAQNLGDLTKRPAWRQAWRNAALSPDIEYEVPVQGAPKLLQEIAEHLRVMRTTVREPDDILVTGGAREGLGLLLTSLGTTRGRKLLIGLEESGVQTLGAVAKQHGAEVILLPVDQQGLLVGAIPDSVLDAVIVTPSFQYPKGAALPLSRRRELIEWARKNGALIIEDDFDSELRFLRSPLPTLAALDDPDRGVVATLGSFSATLSLSVAAGFLILPGFLRQQIISVRTNLSSPVAPILQIALAELLASGELRRHVARLRRARL